MKTRSKIKAGILLLGASALVVLFQNCAKGFKTSSAISSSNGSLGTPIPIGPTPVDTTAPSTPNNLMASAVSSSQINLSWSASTDNVAVTGYRIYRGGAQLITVGNVLSYQDMGLTAATAYSYTVQAVDAVNNWSNQSGAASATTQAAGGGGGSGAGSGRAFYDDFEAGNTSKWTGSTDGRNHCRVVTTSLDGIAGPYAGSRMVACNDNGTVSWDRPDAFETLGYSINYTSEFFIRAHLRVDSNHARDGGSGKKIMRIFNWTGDMNTYNDIFETLRTGTGTSNEGVAGGSQFATYWGGANGDATNSSTGWHKIEFYINTSGVIKVWHDGVLVQNLSGLPTGRGTWAPFNLTSNFSASHDAVNTIYFDNFEIFTDKVSGFTGSMSNGTVQAGP